MNAGYSWKKHFFWTYFSKVLQQQLTVLKLRYSIMDFTVPGYNKFREENIITVTLRGKIYKGTLSYSTTFFDHQPCAADPRPGIVLEQHPLWSRVRKPQGSEIWRGVERTKVICPSVSTTSVIIYIFLNEFNVLKKNGKWYPQIIQDHQSGTRAASSIFAMIICNWTGLPQSNENKTRVGEHWKSKISISKMNTPKFRTWYVYQSAPTMWRNMMSQGYTHTPFVQVR